MIDATTSIPIATYGAGCSNRPANQTTRLRTPLYNVLAFDMSMSVTKMLPSATLVTPPKASLCVLPRDLFALA